MKVFAVRLKQARSELGMTQQVLADQIGISKPRLSEYERGLRNPKMDSLIAVSQVLNRSIDWLVGLKD